MHPERTTSRRMTVRDIMTGNPIAVLPADSVVTAARVMRDRDIGMLPVVDAFDTMQLIGIITDHDIATRCTANGHVDACMVAEHMTVPPLHTARPMDDAHDVGAVLHWSTFRRLPVVDEDGTLVGILTRSDLAKTVRMREIRLIESTLAVLNGSPRRHNRLIDSGSSRF